MQKPYSSHAQFFTSLKHLEKRLKLETHQSSQLPPPPPPPPVNQEEIVKETQQTESLGTPIYLYNQSATINTNASSIQEESEPPQEFLSGSPPPDHQEAEIELEGRSDQPERLDLGDDIGVLMQLLRLSDSEEMDGKVGSDDEFYGRIVGMKGPKNVKEKQRLEGWIKHFLKGERKEPFRLVNLLLGKAAFLHSDDGFGGLVYPSTIDEFLEVDPPKERRVD